MDIQLLTDNDLDAMRHAPKVIVNPSSRWKIKGAHQEKSFLLRDARDATQEYRLFLRVSSTNTNVFSTGLTRVWSSDETLILVRYNGPYHPHRNILERTKVPAGCHRHLATQRYIVAGLDFDGFAEPAAGYNSVEGAFGVLCNDCNVATPEHNPLQPELEF
jgi:hypothetical protein